MAKVGDIVRYLNAVGGGRVVRIDGNMAWVDDEGFETPVLLRECVVVSTANEQAHTTAADKSGKTAGNNVSKNNGNTAGKTSHTNNTGNNGNSSSLEKGDAKETEVEIVEVPGNDALNIVLGFEPTDRHRLTETDFDATLINDSNYFIYFQIATHDNDTVRWTPRYDGILEPNTELWLGTVKRMDIATFDNIRFQYMAFKRNDEYRAKQPGAVNLKVDTTKFFKLHCYRANTYFENEVLAFPLVENDAPAGRQTIDLEVLRTDRRFDKPKDIPLPHKDIKPRPTKSKTPTNEPLVVDLHIDQLLDTTAGMSSADILNYQIDTFRRIMDENLRNYGRRIVFIHGKGDGVLRHALLKELSHRYKGHEANDASFREYGYGATQVSIRQNINPKRR